MSKYKKHSINYLVCILVFYSFISLVALSIAQDQDAPVYEKRQKKDPFIPLVTYDGQLTNIRSEDDTSEFNLEGIMYDTKGQSLAIIDGEIVKKGDTVRGIKIVEIRKEGIVYIKDGEVFILNTEGE